MATYTNKVEVLQGHLEEIMVALDSATGYHIADDLTREYKNVGGVHRPSNLTKRLEKARDHVEGYLRMEFDSDIPQE